MNGRGFYEQLEEWEKNGEHRIVIGVIEALPDGDRDYRLSLLLARAYAMLAVSADASSPDRDMLKHAFSILTPFVEDGCADAAWNKLVGFTLFNLGVFSDAVSFFEHAQRLDPGDVDLIPYIEECREREKARLDSLELYDSGDADAVRAHIEDYFGEAARVIHDPLPEFVDIDVLVIPPKGDYGWVTLATLGAGAHIMKKNTEDDEFEPDRLYRAELLLCLPPECADLSAQDDGDVVPPWALHMLRGIARRAASSDARLDWGCTVVTSRGPDTEDVRFNGAILVTPGKFCRDADICDLPSGDGVSFFQLVPLYPEEIDYKLKTDADALLDCFSDDMLAVVDEHRPSVIDSLGRPIEYGITVDTAEFHIKKIEEKRLPLNPLSAYNHMAVYLRWCMERDLMSDVFLDRYGYLSESVRRGRAATDLRFFLRADRYMDGELTLPCFNCDGVDFTHWYYMSGDASHSYMSDLAMYAERVFGVSRCRSSEFSGEAYLFIPWSEQYYTDMAAVLDARFDEWLAGEGVGDAEEDELFLPEDEMRDLLPGLRGPRGCLATDSIMFDGRPVEVCFRERPAPADKGWDSGWRFMTLDEYDEYAGGDDPNPVDDVLDTYDLNTVCNYDPDIKGLLGAPFGAYFERGDDGFIRRE